MNIDLTTPALLFSTISLLLLAYTNRFLALATVIRTLHGAYQKSPDPVAAAQITNLRKRVNLIKDMQSLESPACCRVPSVWVRYLPD